MASLLTTPDAAFDGFAAREPYFAVVTDPKFLRANLTPAHEREFFATGETLVDRMFAMFPRLRERRTQLAGSLSGGEQQMLAIARALISEPRLLIMDEPSLGLAPKVVQQLFEQIREINARGLSILMVEQNARQALKIAHYAYLLEVGRLASEGPSATLMASDEVQRVYLGV